MAAGAIVGALKYLVEVDAERAAMEVDKFLAEAQAKVEAAGGDATFRLLAESAQLDRKLAKADAEVDRLKAKRAEVKITGDTSALDRAIVAAEAQVKALARERADIKIKTTGAVQALAELKAIQAVKEGLTKSTVEDTAATDRQSLAVAKLRENYNRLASERLKLERIKPASRRTEGENLAIARMAAEMRVMENEAQRLGGDLGDITKDVEGTNSGFRNWLRTIGDTRVNMGPFSGTIKSMGVALTGLGPIIYGLIGSLSALVGAVGAGLVGAFGVAAGAAAGLGLAAVGAGIALHQPIHQLGVAHKAATAYADAVQKYGKNSSQAQRAQKAMNDSLKGLPPQAQSAVRTLGQMRSEFMKLGGQRIRGDFFRSFASGIRTAKELLPAFARGSADAFHAASQGFNNWMRGLRGGEARGILSNLLGNITKDIGPVMAGLGSLGTAFARFINLASNAGPGIASTFQRWAAGIEQGTAAGSGFGAKVDSLISKAKSLGRFLSGAGRLAVTFFGAGADSGQHMLDTMTAAENRWTSWMRSVEGQRSLHQFFADSVANTTQLFRAIAPLARTFTALSAAFLPLTTGLLKGATYIARFVHFLTEIPGVLPAIHALGIGLAGIFALTKIQKFTSMVRSFLVSIGVMTAEQDANTAATTANTAALEANTAAMEANAAARGGAAIAAGEQAAAMTAADAEIAGATVATDAAAASTVGLGAALAAVAAPVAAFGAALVGVQLGAGALIGRGPIGDYKATLKELPPIQNKTAASARAMSQANRDSADAWARVNKLMQEGKTRTAAFTQAYQRATQQDQRGAEATKVNTQAVQQQREKIAQLTKSVQDYHKAQAVTATASRTPIVSRGSAVGIKSAADQVKDMSGAVGQLHLAEINLQRTMQGLTPIAEAQAGVFQQLRQNFGKGVTAKIGLQASPQAAAQIARTANQLHALGRTKATAKILLDSGSAEAKLHALQNLLARTEVQRKAKVAADVTGAIHSVAQFLGLAKQTDKSHTTNVHANTSSATGALSGVLNLMHTIAQGVTGFVHIITGHGHAAGGIEDPVMQRAYREAGRAPGLDPRSGARVKSPRYVVGEERGRTEFIITDNPTYRKSNLAFLAEAAKALGAVVAVPGYGKGGKHRHGGGKGGKAPAYDPEAPTLDDQVAPQSHYQQLEDLVQRDAALVDFATRSNDLSHTGTGPILQAIARERADYGTLANYIDSLIKSDPQKMMVPVPNVPSKAKGKKAQAAKNRAQAAHDAAQAHNQAVQSNWENLANELWTIRNVTIPGLDLDAAEVANGQQQAAAAQTLSYNTARQDLFRSFGSNVSTIIGTAFSSAAAAVTPPTLNYNPSSTMQSVSGSGVASMGPTLGSGGGVTINNQFASPPPDPFTWTQQQQFEVQAAS